MLKEVSQVVRKNLNGSNGLSGRAQAAALALAIGLGAMKVLRAGFAIETYFWRQFMRPQRSLKQLYGSWAAVTGATDGIGRAYCDELAKQGLNILLISRAQAKLDSVAAEISSTYGVETRTVCIDLAAAANKPCEGSEWTSLKSIMSELDVGVFISNAGYLCDWSFLHEHTPQDIDTCVALNSTATVKATYSVLPAMLSRGKGTIVFISSMVGVADYLPCGSVYAATKAFVNHFGRSLAAEYKSKGIDIQVQTPGLISTNMTYNRPESPVVASAKNFVKAGVRHIGYETEAVPYPMHALTRSMSIAVMDKGPVQTLREETLQRRATVGN